MQETFTYDDMNRLTGNTLTRPSGWLAGGGGNGDHPPGVPYLLNGVITIDLPEVDIVSNSYNEFEYTPYYYGGGGGSIT